MSLRFSKTLNKAIRYVILLFFSVLFVFPLYWMVTGSFKKQIEIWEIPPKWFPSEIRLDNYIHLFSTKPVGQWLFNSIYTSIMSVILILILSAMAGYAYAKKKFPGNRLLFAMVVAMMMMPHQTILVPLYILSRNLGLIDNYWGVILPAIAYPFGVFLIRQFALTIPDEVLEAAKMDGAGEIRMFAAIVMPLLLPALGSLAIFAFMHTWNDYLWQLVILQSEHMLTLPLGISTVAYDEITINYGFAMAGAAIAAVPMILFFISLQKSFITGITLGSVKG